MDFARPIMLDSFPDGTIAIGDCVFFGSFIVVVGLILRQVVVAVLLDNFTQASYAEKERKVIAKANSTHFVKKTNVLDPLLAGLAHFDTAKDLTKRIRLLFEVLDSDESGSLSVREMADGLSKFRVKPHIKLSLFDWDAMTLHGSMFNENKEMGPDEFVRMIKLQFKVYVQRHLTECMDTSNPYKNQTSTILFVMKLLAVHIGCFSSSSSLCQRLNSINARVKHLQLHTQWWDRDCPCPFLLPKSYPCAEWHKKKIMLIVHGLL